mgnify:CR=1 FL=1
MPFGIISLCTAGKAQTMDDYVERMFDAGIPILVGTDSVQTGDLPGASYHDELALLDDYDGVDVTPLTRELSASNPLGLNLMRITVDGEPIDDPGRSSADIQRCTDVALERADIRFRFDNLESDRRLSVSAAPDAVRFERAQEVWANGEPVLFQMYANYGAFIDRAEVRIFDDEEEAAPAESASPAAQIVCFQCRQVVEFSEDFINQVGPVARLAPAAGLAEGVERRI